MKVTMYTAEVGYVAYEQMLGLLKNRDRSQQHIILTPDRFNFNIENQIFDILGEDSLFDVNVMTLTRLTHFILNQSGANGKVLTLQGASSIIQKLLIENSTDLKSFGKSYKFKGFSKELFQTISMFKSCNIDPSDINTEVNNVSLCNKLQDIKLIYTKYEEYLQNDYTDSFNRLNLLAKYIGDNVNNINFYFVGFDDFTPEQYNVIKSMIKHGTSVNLATTYSNNPNKKIYLNNIYFNIIDICKTIGVNVNIVNTDNKLSKSKQFLSRYAFAYGGSEDINDYLSVIKYDTIDDEIRHTLQSIYKDVVTRGANYNDYCIIVPSFDGYDYKLKLAFEKYNIPYFLDKSKALRDVSVFEFISKFVNLPLAFSRESLIDILKNKYLGVDFDRVCEYEREIVKNGIYGNALFNCNDEKLDNVLKLISSYINQDNNTIDGHINNLLNVLDKLNFAENFQIIIDSYKTADILEYKVLGQFNYKLSKILDELKGVLGDYICDYSTFAMLIDSYIDNTPIALPPITNCVFVGDQVGSYITHKKYVYMLGVCEGAVPAYGADLGIITDEDIASMNKALSPTVAYTNKKHRYKVFENLFAADDRLTISYIEQSQSGERVYPASFLTSLAQMGHVYIINGSAECDVLQTNVQKINADNVLFNSLNKAVATENYVDILKVIGSVDSKALLELAGTLKSVVNKDYESNLNYCNTKDNVVTDGLYFGTGKSSITQAQTFYECPYKYFARYGLKLKEVELDDIRPLDFGNIIHRFLELSVDTLIASKYTDKELKEYVFSQLENILSNEYEGIYNNPKNKYAIKSLHNECVRISKAVVTQIKAGKYVPRHYEMHFDDNKSINVNINGKTIRFGGIIDRVDVYDDYFRIIDYKTGSSEFKDFGDIQSGVKMQLIVYLKAYMDNYKLIPGGVFYLPISNEYQKDSSSLYKLKGVILDQLNNIFAMDEGLNKPNATSKIINVKTNKDGLPSSASENLRISKEDFDRLAQFVYHKLELAVKRILSGEIQPHPYKGDREACTYCPYSGMCGFKLDYQNEYNEKQNVKRVADLSDDI